MKILWGRDGTLCDSAAVPSRVEGGQSTVVDLAASRIVTEEEDGLATRVQQDKTKTKNNAL